MLLSALLAAALLGGTPSSPQEDAAAGAARLVALALRGEPRIEAVQRAAAARAAPSRGDAEGWRHRARLAPLVPRIAAEYRHDVRVYRALGVTSSSEVDYVRETPGDAVEVRLSWDLEELVFSRAELEAAAAAERAEEKRRAAVERATRLYYERLRLRVELAESPPAAARERAEIVLKLEGVTAELGALTGLYEEER
jgi:hypothetical protein